MLKIPENAIHLLAQLSIRARGFLRKAILASSENAEKAVSFFLVGAMASLAVWFMTVKINEFSKKMDLYEDPKIYNLTRDGVLWDVFYGQSEQCGHIPCHLEPTFPESGFQKKMLLPAREFPLKGYQKGQKIYLRTTIEIPENTLNSYETIAFHSIYIWASHYRLYINEHLVEEGSAETLNVTLPKSLISTDRKVRLAFEIDPGELSYQGLANRNDLVVGAKQALKRTEVFAHEQKTTLPLWFLLPKLVFCLIFSLVYIIVSSSPAIFMFIGYLFFGALANFLDSGFATEMLPSVKTFQFWMDMAQNAGNLLLIAFVYERYGGGRYRTLRITGVGISLLILIAGGMHFGVSPASGIKTLDFFHAVSYPGAFFWGWILSRKKAERSLDRALGWFLLISVVPAALHSWHLIADILGIEISFKGSFHHRHDLIMFFVLTAFAIIDVGRSLATKTLVERELAHVNERLDLARTVQGMLLPAHQEGDCHGYKYRFFYDPAEKMSGDWMNVWETPDETHLFIGDVVGKGPQAALGVAVIASIIMECRLTGTSIDECISRINTQLIALFGKNITSTLAVATLSDRGIIELRNAGFFGWVLLRDDLPQTVFLRAPPLGMSQDGMPAKTIIENSKGVKIFTFTDGCLEGPRALKQLMKRLKENKVSSENFDQWRNMILETGKDHVLTDDKTILLIASQSEASFGSIGPADHIANNENTDPFPGAS